MNWLTKQAKNFAQGSWLWWAALILAVVWAVAGGFITRAGQEAGESKGPIKLAYVSWADAVAMTHLAKVVLEEELGYTDVQLTLADPAPVFASIADGDQDVFLDAWLPLTHRSYMEALGDRIDDLGVIFEAARIGLVVPAYVDIDSITEMNAHKDQFNGEIVGIDSGAGIMRATEDALDQYTLDYTLVASSDGAMNAALEDAIRDNRWIVVTGWQPHWKFARHDLKFLDDPKAVYGVQERIHAVARLGFREDYPEVARFFANMRVPPGAMNQLLDRVEQASGNTPAACRAWAADHEQLIQSWLPE